MTQPRIATARIAPTLVVWRGAWGAAIPVTRSFDGVRDIVRRDLTIAGRVPCTATAKPTKPPVLGEGAISSTPRRRHVMPGRDVLIMRNAEAAGREAGRADPDGRGARATTILSPFTSRPIGQDVHAAGVRSDRRGRREG